MLVMPTLTKWQTDNYGNKKGGWRNIKMVELCDFVTAYDLC